MPRILTTAMFTIVALCSCSEHKMIPEQTMKDIMRESLIAQAAATYGNSPTTEHLLLDTIDMHTPILGRYGYTLGDFRYTIREMSIRKSNPLGSLLESVSADIRATGAIAAARYQVQRRIDTLALAFVADTIYAKDTTIIGKLKNYSWTLSPTNGDSLMPQGTYTLTFDYSSGTHAKSYNKVLRNKKFITEKISTEGSQWLPVAPDTTTVTNIITIDRNNIRKIEYTLVDQPTAKGTIPDTLYVSRFRVVYTMSLSRARAVYYTAKSGLATLDILYQRRYFTWDTTSVAPLEDRPPFIKTKYERAKLPKEPPLVKRKPLPQID